MIPTIFRFVLKNKLGASWPVNTDGNNNYATIALHRWKFDTDGALNYSSAAPAEFNLTTGPDISNGSWHPTAAFNNNPLWQGAFCVFGVAHDLAATSNENSVLCFIEWPFNYAAGEWPINNYSGNPGVDPETDLPLVAVNQITADGGNAVYKEVTFEI